MFPFFVKRIPSIKTSVAGHRSWFLQNKPTFSQTKFYTSSPEPAGPITQKDESTWMRKLILASAISGILSAGLATVDHLMSPNILSMVDSDYYHERGYERWSLYEQLKKIEEKGDSMEKKIDEIKLLCKNQKEPVGDDQKKEL